VGRPDGQVSVGARVNAARRRLRDAGLPADAADLDARLIAQHLLGWTTERFLISADAFEPHDFAASYEALIRRRGAREPLAYIVGHREFWGLEIEVTPAVLIPRPETEFLVESLLARFPHQRAPIVIADACTGSGCVAIAIARERPSAKVIATDISDEALAVARRNAKRHGVADRVHFVRTDLVAGIAGRLDAIVANPPYVPYCHRPALESEIAHHEPGLAIFAGEDGLAAIERLVSQASALIRQDGTLMFEFGFGQDDAITGLISSTAGLELIELRQDLQDIPRIAIARRTTNDQRLTTNDYERLSVLQNHCP
jgi:release factor glutamine methyltransferase